MSNLQRFGSEQSKERPKTRAFGIGGAGRNILSYLMDEESLMNLEAYELGRKPRLNNCNFIRVKKEDMRKIYEGNMKIGMRSSGHSKRKIKDHIEDSEMHYIVSGLGGETGSWTTPVCTYLGEQTDTFTIALVATPFDKEGKERVKFANQAKEKIRPYADILAVFENSRLLDLNPHLPMTKAFNVMNSIISLPVKDFNAVMTRGDIPYLKKFCSGVDEFRIGAGYGKGRRRGERASEEAYRSPWLDDPEEYETVLTVVSSGKGRAELEAEDALSVIKEKSPDANVMWGLRKIPDLGERTRVTLLAGK